MNDTAELNENKKSNFWLFAVLLCILLISTMARDINRPFIGLHSWGEASIAWRSRVYLKYDISYTKLLSTWAVGNPPEETAHHYLDHPQLGMLLRTADMLVFGIKEYAQRAGGIIRAVICLLLFLIIVRRLTDDKTALLAGALFALFPLTGFFGPRDWGFPLGLAATWYYLVAIGGFKENSQRKPHHMWGLALTLFFVLQMSWSGFFYALAIGVHYVCRCIRRRKMPEKLLLAILIIAPLSSLLINFAVMAAGHSWDISKIVELYQWRAGKGEMAQFEWLKWFARFWEFAVMNFSLVVLIIAIAYLTVGQLFIWAGKEKQNLRFPQFWLFLLPGVFQLFLLKGTLWMHHYWERPLAPFIAIAAALGLLTLFDILKKLRPIIAKIVITALAIVITVSCAMGLNHYHSIRHFSPAKVKLFKMLNQQIPPDGSLLSFQNHVVEQHKAKGAFYRPEVAWYLDRHIVKADTIEKIDQAVKTGKYRYYLIPAHQQLAPIIRYMQQRYKFKSIADDPGGPGKAPMMPQLIFDLKTPATSR